MKAKKEPAKPKDALQERLQESLRKARPRILPALLLSLVLAVGLLGLLIYLIYPRPDPPRLHVIAFDQVGVAGEEVILHGRLALPTDAARAVPLENLEILFEDARFRQPGEKAKQIAAKTQADGSASSPWSFPGGFKEGEFIARYVGTSSAPGGGDRGRVVLWPKDSRLVIVQVARTLTLEGEEAFDEKNVLNIMPAPGAAEALTALGRAGYHIVYLARGAQTPISYQKMRGWIRNQAAEVKGFPAGPVLTQASLREQFTGPHLAIVGSSEAAQELHAAGWTVYLLGEGAGVPAGVQPARNWTDLPRLLPE